MPSRRSLIRASAGAAVLGAGVTVIPFGPWREDEASAATTITPPSVAATSRATPSGSCPWKNRNETATVCRFCRMKTSTRISEATKTTTAVHTVLVRVRDRSGSAGARGDPSIGGASEDGRASVLPLSSGEPMLQSPYSAGPGE